MDLLWMILRARYGERFDCRKPSSMEYSREEKDQRSARQIIADIQRKLKE